MKQLRIYIGRRVFSGNKEVISLDFEFSKRVFIRRNFL
jgi:hypothetical protein